MEATDKVDKGDMKDRAVLYTFITSLSRYTRSVVAIKP